MTGVELKIAKKEDAEEWDRIVKTSPHGTLFHTWKWLKITEKHSGKRLYPLMGYKGSELIGVYPLFSSRKYFLRMVFSPPPSTGIPYLGIVLDKFDKLKQDKREVNFREFYNSAEKFIRSELNANYVQISLSPGFIDARPFKWSGYNVEPVYHYLINLEKGEKSVWSGFKGSLRAHIKKAQKEGITVKQGEKEEVKLLFNRLKERYAEQGRRIPMSKSYLLDIFKEFYPQNMRVFMAEYNGEYVGGIITLIFKEKILFWIGAPKAKLKGLSPNDLVQWECIKWAIENGLKYYEEVGANTPRLCEFKSRYNPELTICLTARKVTTITKLLEKIYRLYLRNMVEI